MSQLLFSWCTLCNHASNRVFNIVCFPILHRVPTTLIDLSFFIDPRTRPALRDHYCWTIPYICWEEEKLQRSSGEVSKCGIMTNGCLIQNTQGDTFSAVLHLVGSSSSHNQPPDNWYHLLLTSPAPALHIVKEWGKILSPGWPFMLDQAIDIHILASDLQLWRSLDI